MCRQGERRGRAPGGKDQDQAELPPLVVVVRTNLLTPAGWGQPRQPAAVRIRAVVGDRASQVANGPNQERNADGSCGKSISRTCTLRHLSSEGGNGGKGD